MKKKAKCMADGGMPQERPKKPEEVPEWKKSLTSAWQAITGTREAPKERPPTADGLGDTVSRMWDRKRQIHNAANRADGGIPKEDATDRRMREIAEKYGMPAPERKQPATQQPAPTQKTSPGREGAPRPTLPESVLNRNDQLQQIMDYYDRKFAAGGIPRIKFKGKGGPRDDKIPVVVAGEEINVSNEEEALILPAKTAKNPQAVAAIGKVIEQSNDGRKPAMGVEDGGKYEDGALSRYYAKTGLVPGITHEEARKGSFPGVADVAHGTEEDVGRDVAAGNYGTAVGRALRGAVTLPFAAASDLGSMVGNKLDPAADALKTFATGDGTPAREAGKPTPPRPSAAPVGATSSGATPAPLAPGSAATPAPIQGQVGIGGGAPSLVTSGGVDANGNSTARTEQMRGQLAQMQAENASGRQGIGEARWNAIPTALQSERADHDRFNQFVRESNFNSLARDLATGGGNARTNAGKIAALAAMGADIRGAQNNQTAADVAQVRNQTQRAVTEESGQTQRDVAGLQGQNQMAVESARQNSPASRLLGQKAQGEIADASATRNARSELAAAADSGDQESYERAKRKAMAFGIVKPTANEFQVQTDPMGQAYRLNKNTGATDSYDRKTNTWKSVGAGLDAPRFASEAEAEAAIKAGKVKAGQKIMIGDRSLSAPGK